MDISLPKNLSELSNICPGYELEKNWSGAVVMLIVENKLVFIRRSETMPTHKGQIGFMGGHKKSEEICPTVTAKREFAEESDISPDAIEVLGLLKPVVTLRRKWIIPALAKTNMSEQEFLQNVKSNGEWDNIVMAPIDYLGNQSLWSKGSYNIHKSYPVYFASLSNISCTYLKPVTDPYILWGASAKMVLNFFKSR